VLDAFFCIRDRAFVSNTIKQYPMHIRTVTYSIINFICFSFVIVYLVDNIVYWGQLFDSFEITNMCTISCFNSPAASLLSEEQMWLD